MAEAYLERHPMAPHTIRTMVEIEDEEHLQSFLEKYTTPFDCSARALLFVRYGHRGDAEKFDKERRYQLYNAFAVLLCPSDLLKLDPSKESKLAADEFMKNMLSVIRSDAADDRPDMWVQDRLELGIKSARRLVSMNKNDEAIQKLESVVKLLEETMKITDETALPTSCRFLEGMEWNAHEDWDQSNNEDAPEERMIYIGTQMDDGMRQCYCIYPSEYYRWLQGSDFESLRGRSNFENLCERVKMLIVTK